MKLVIFGATGTMGRHVVFKALEQGYEVSAFARNPAKFEVDHPNLTLIAGDVFDPIAVESAIKGSDVVLISLGSIKLKDRVRSVGTRNIVQAMEKHGVKRLICQSTLGTGDSWQNLNFFWKYLMFSLVLRHVFKDHVIQESIVKKSSLDWTIVRPAAFTDEPETEFYQSGFSAAERQLTLKIPRANVASFMLQQVDDDQYMYQTPGLSI